MDIVAKKPHRPPLRVSFNAAKRLLSGPDADSVRAMLIGWPGIGLLYGGTQPVKAPDPLGSLHDFVVLLTANDYALSDELLALLPPAKAIPRDAVA